jgi:aryl-alcohol dehydrogenase-like predicted oxidoreductase
MALPTRPLGSSGLEITTVRFGAWAAGRGWFDGQGPQGDAKCIAAMWHALDLGVNWIDTVAVHNLGTRRSGW